MKKVVVVSDTFFPKYDGITRFIKEVIPSIKDDFDLKILTAGYDKKKTESWEGIEIIKFPVFRLIKVLDYSPVIPNPFTVSKEIKNSDVVFVQSITHAFTVPLSIFFGSIYKKKVVCYFHQMGWEQIYIHYKKTLGGFIAGFMDKLVRILTTIFGNRCDLIIVPSESIIDVLDKMGIKAETQVVRLGVNTNEFSPPKNKALAKKKVGINENSFVIGYCGRISFDKDIETLIAAFDKLKNKYDNLYLLLVGDGDKTKKKLKNKKDVKITGFVEDVVSYYQAMDVFVLPSLTETTGLSTPEAMSCGVPVITTPFGFALTHISNGYNGLIFSPKDVDGLIEQLDKVYNDKELRTNLAVNAHKTIVDGFTWKTTIKEIKEILKNI